MNDEMQGQHVQVAGPTVQPQPPKEESIQTDSGNLGDKIVYRKQEEKTSDKGDKGDKGEEKN